MSGRKPHSFRTYEAQSRLVAAMLAAHPDFKPNYKVVAQYYGGSTTASAIEHRFRPLRQVSEMFRQAVDNGYDPEKLDIDKPREEIAKMYGESTTGGIEFHFRGVRANAEVLKQAIEANTDPKEAYTAFTGIGASVGSGPSTPSAGSARKRKPAASTAKKPSISKPAGRTSSAKSRRTMPKPTVAEDSDVDLASLDHSGLGNSSPTQPKKRARVADGLPEDLRISPPIFDLRQPEKMAALKEAQRVARLANASRETTVPTETEASTPFSSSAEMFPSIKKEFMDDHEAFPQFSSPITAGPGSMALPQFSSPITVGPGSMAPGPNNPYFQLRLRPTGNGYVQDSPPPAPAESWNAGISPVFDGSGQHQNGQSFGGQHYDGHRGDDPNSGDI
ncbi:hypothetical protein B0T25DRAFT_111477 [Lasiosphaeria hispida]|uniref:Uncharacterized protein n=1 Tax=Lasiosphaeria hispida TaxID=260671 RepID=A0AAJ0HQY7_9PEZI|nr:hypothetical protein B0T25DRAFT_111477 [Lasiosphaeria hispida]